MSTLASAPDAPTAGSRTAGPRTVEIGLAAAGIAGVAAFVAGVMADVAPLRLVAKPVPVLAAAVLAAMQRTAYGRTIAVGLVFGALGDVLLEASPRLFLAGLGAFLAGHVVYVAAFVRDERQLRIGRALPSFALGIGMLSVLWPGLGGLRYPVAAYMLVICAMAWRAAARVGPGRSGAWLAVAGAWLFLASDSVLGVRKFLGPFPADRTVILATYWAAQLLVALSARAAAAGPPEHAPAATGPLPAR